MDALQEPLIIESMRKAFAGDPNAPEEPSPESERRLREIIDALPAAIYTTDAEGRLTHFNKAAVEFSGRVPELGTDHWCISWKLYYSDGRPMRHDECPMAIALKEGRIIRGAEAIAERPDGKRIWFTPYPTPLRDARGRIVGGVNMLVDITERKKNETALREAHELLTDKAKHLDALVQQRTAKLQEVIGELESFSYSISHDMRAPLRAMQSFAKLLEEDCGDKVSPEGKDYIRRIIAGADRMDKLILDVLTYSRVARSDYDLRPLELHHVLQGIVESYPAFHPPQAEIELAGTFPKVTANEAALTQCISNLLGNAVKFVPPGTVPRVRVWAERNNGSVRLFVKDNGIGIPEDADNRIFGIFQRFTKTHEGTGIGLAIVKKAAERMHGRVGYDSTLGQGSTFWLELKSVAN